MKCANQEKLANREKVIVISRFVIQYKDIKEMGSKVSCFVRFFHHLEKIDDKE